MALRHGQHKTKRKEGTRCCFFCRKDVTEYYALSWENVTELYRLRNLTAPQALACKECSEKPNEWLYGQFWGVVMATELKKFADGEPSLIVDKAMARGFVQALKDSGAVDDARKFVEGDV